MAMRAGSTSDSRQARRTHPRRNLKVTNKYGDSRSQEREPVSTLDGQIALRTFSLMKNTSFYLERAALRLNSHPYRSFWLIYRNHTARRPKSAVYAEVVCRKCGERSTDERQSHLDTSTTPVCPLFTQSVHSFVDVHV